MQHDPAHSHDFDHGNRAAERNTRLVLWITLAMMVLASLERLLFPVEIHYQQALGVASVGLLVNLVCAWILGRTGHHQFACVLRLATTAPTLTARDVRGHLAHFPALVHATVEIDYSPSS
jgi:Co/Zn/Cd efflux system component